MTDDGRPYKNIPEPLRTLALETHGALHVLWTKNAHQVGYVKSEWKTLADAISKLIRTANEPVHVPHDDAWCIYTNGKSRYLFHARGTVQGHVIGHLYLDGKRRNWMVTNISELSTPDAAELAALKLLNKVKP